jgi:CRP/FNR family cyclic AMP-dependent transcriptional regulator
MPKTIPDELQKLLDVARLKRVQKGQVILYVGDPTIEVYLLKSGVVKIYNVDEAGTEKVLHLLRPPLVMPFAFYSGTDTMTYWYYGALIDCDLYVLTRRSLERLMERDPETLHFLVRNFADEVHDVMERLESLGKSDSSVKLLLALRYLANFHSESRRGGWCRIAFPVNQQLLADMTGVSRETVSMAMKLLYDNKIVRSPRLTTLEINVDRLKNYRSQSTKERESI